MFTLVPGAPRADASPTAHDRSRSRMTFWTAASPMSAGGSSIRFDSPARLRCSGWPTCHGYRSGASRSRRSTAVSAPTSSVSSSICPYESSSPSPFFIFASVLPRAPRVRSNRRRRSSRGIALNSAAAASAAMSSASRSLGSFTSPRRVASSARLVSHRGAHMKHTSTASSPIDEVIGAPGTKRRVTANDAVLLSGNRSPQSAHRTADASLFTSIFSQHSAQ